MAREAGKEVISVSRTRCKVVKRVGWERVQRTELEKVLLDDQGGSGREVKRERDELGKVGRVWCPGGRLHTSLPRMCGLKLEGMGPFWAWREGNGVPLYGYIFRGFTPVWVCF